MPTYWATAIIMPSSSLKDIIMFPMQRTRPDYAPSQVRRERPLNPLSKVRQSVVVLVYFTGECLHAVPPKKPRSEEQ